MKVLVTGGDGFIGKNLVLRLQEASKFECIIFGRNHTDHDLLSMIDDADVIIHLAGENRPEDPQQFVKTNLGLTDKICAYLSKTNKKTPILFASSTQAQLDNLYGRSKRAAEESLRHFAKANENAVCSYRLPGVFGKWCKPNYNSVVATFCYNIANDLTIQIDNPDHPLNLVFIDDVVDSFVAWVSSVKEAGYSAATISPQYETTVGQLAEQLREFEGSRASLITGRVGSGLVRALYATYVSYLPISKFKYVIPSHVDERGAFVEMLKTEDSGQFSFFTAHPGITRGGHYHHAKTEKFLVVKGEASFRFRHVLTNESFTVETRGEMPTIVETIPGWSHDITNTGDDELLVMLWANEIFDKNNPDTIASRTDLEKA